MFFILIFLNLYFAAFCISVEAAPWADLETSQSPSVDNIKLSKRDDGSYHAAGIFGTLFGFIFNIWHTVFYWLVRLVSFGHGLTLDYYTDVW